MTMEGLLQGEAFHTVLDEQIVFSQLEQGRMRSGVFCWPAAI